MSVLRREAETGWIIGEAQALPDESGKERTDETVAPINLANPVELIVLSVKQKAGRCP
jgi:hypothetical protein